MNAEEVRSVDLYSAGEDNAEKQTQDCALFLREIAAQLADMNEARKPRWVRLTYREVPFFIDANQVTGVQVAGVDNHMREVFCSIGLSGTEWSKSCDGSLSEVLAKLGIQEVE